MRKTGAALLALALFASTAPAGAESLRDIYELALGQRRAIEG